MQTLISNHAIKISKWSSERIDLVFFLNLRLINEYYSISQTDFFKLRYINFQMKNVVLDLITVRSEGKFHSRKRLAFLK